jgi:uncharacterized protein
MKYLLLFAFLAAIWWVWNKRRMEAPDERQAAAPPVDNMLVCAHCGVHFPERDGLKEGEQAYCCEAHRLAARSAER